MSRTLTASDRTRLIKLASELPVGDATRKAILVGIKAASWQDYEDSEEDDAREPLTADDVSHAIFLQSSRYEGQLLSREELLGLALKELRRYGNSEASVDRLLDKALLDMVKDRSIKAVDDDYLGVGYIIPR
jgi:hypothetical protein